ncbi:MAG: hypothetical protein RLY20_2151, partial [Verrucomicrobiota bacterium]
EMQSIYQAGPAGKCKTPPAIITQPTGGRAVVGSNFTLRVVATGSAPKFRYQWRQDSVNLFGATNANFNFNPGKPGVTNRFSCLVTNSFGAVTSLVAVVAVNNRPIATNDGRTLNEDTSITFHLNGSDLDADPLTYAITLLPTHGTLLLASNFATSGLLAYQPNTNFSGLDIFTFRVNDGYENSDDVKVTITVLPVNDPPIADSQSVSLNEDTAAPITLTASDVDGDPLTFNVGVPQHGTLTGFAPNLSYQPFTNYNGPDQFSFTVNDGTTDSAPATVSLTVLPVNDPPVLVAQVFTRFLLSSNDGELRVIAGKDDLAHVVFDASLTTDVDNDPLTFVWKERAATNVLGSQVVATNTLPPGEHTIQLLVSDGIVTVTNEFLVQVITGDEAVDLFSDLVELSELKHGVRQPLLAMLHSAAHGFNAGLDWSGVHHLELVQDRIRDWVAPVDAELAEQWLWITQQILDIFGEIKPGNAGAVKMDQDAGGKQTLRFLGDRNRPYLIEASVDLIRWEVIGAAIERGPGRYEFNDLRPSDAPSRFYRIRTL